jgi:hypothetical protein
MALILVMGLLLAVMAGAGWLLWRRVERMGGEIQSLRAQMDAFESMGAVRRRVGDGLRLAPIDEAAKPAPVIDKASARVLRFNAEAETARADNWQDTVRGVALALAATAPAFALFFGVDLGPISAAGIAIGAGMMLLALSRRWRAAAWASVITAGVWMVTSFALGSAETSPALVSSALAFAGAAGLTQAFLSRLAPGAGLTLIAAIGALVLGGQIGLIGPAGLAFSAIVALAAMVGALNLRLEAIHIGAFGAALIGLFVLSGQDSAAIWFTPAAAWAGALFLGVTVIRVPDLGPRGVALAGTGVLTPLCLVLALHWSGHGLASPYAAAAALVATALAFGGVIFAAATRGSRALTSLKLTLWVLAAGAFAAVLAAILLAAPIPLAATAFMAGAAALLALDQRLPDAVWRTLAWIAGAFGAAHAGVSVVLLANEAGNPWLLLALGIAAPAALAGGCAAIAQRQSARATAALFESVAIALAVVGASLVLRMLVSGGALMLTPISFAEAGVHIALWLAASLLLAARQRLGAQNTRAFAAMALGVAALTASGAAMLLWLTPHWTARAPGEDAAALLRFDGLGFLAPAIMFWAHWVLWRGRGAILRTRLALGAGALMLAAMVTLLAVQARDPTIEGPDWFGASVGAVAFAVAIGLNFANGVTLQSAPKSSYFEENLQGNRRRQSRRQSR